MLAAMLHLSIAHHYCNGKKIASKVSLSGELAKCGMESSDNESLPSGTKITGHSCNDEVVFLGISSNYEPSLSFAPIFYQNNLQVFAILVEGTAKSLTDLIPLFKNTCPPGVLMSTEVYLSDICNFRI